MSSQAWVCRVSLPGPDHYSTPHPSLLADLAIAYPLGCLRVYVFRATAPPPPPVPSNRVTAAPSRAPDPTIVMRVDAGLNLRYADPATAVVSATSHRDWIAHDLRTGSAPLVIPCKLHGQLHRVEELDLSLNPGISAIISQEFGWVLLATASTTARGFALARQRHTKRLRFAWDSPVQNYLFTTLALGSQARFRKLLATAAAIPLTDLSSRANWCVVRSRTREWETTVDLYPISSNILEPLSEFMAQLGIVLATPVFTACEQVSLGYQHLLDEISHPPNADRWDDAGGARLAYLHAARVLHRFLSDPPTYTVTRTLDALPA